MAAPLPSHGVGVWWGLCFSYGSAGLFTASGPATRGGPKSPALAWALLPACCCVLLYRFCSGPEGPFSFTAHSSIWALTWPSVVCACFPLLPLLYSVCSGVRCREDWPTGAAWILISADLQLFGWCTFVLLWLPLRPWSRNKAFHPQRLYVVPILHLVPPGSASRCQPWWLVPSSQPKRLSEAQGNMRLCCRSVSQTSIAESLSDLRSSLSWRRLWWLMRSFLHPPCLLPRKILISSWGGPASLRVHVM